jgi:nucleotide-binding universal stress UspA family protein
MAKDPPAKPSRILVPTDFSEAAEAAKLYALMLAEGCGATLHILHVLRAQLALEFGRPTAKIVDYARDHAIDLIVIGSHGRGAIDRWWFGSVAQGVLLRAPCPVITVRPRPESRDSGPP